tara:strand:+ start:8969 stop:9457 length:489 start_codon:yes stop_codon:yes gene_type:complete
LFDVDTIRAALPIPEYLEQQYGTRLNRGRGPCPLCGTSPQSTSFSVHNGRWRCFACNQGGDIVELIAMTEGCAWKEALPLAARMAGVAPEGEKATKKKRGPRPPRPYDPNKDYRDIADLRDVCQMVADDPEASLQDRVNALHSVHESNETLDFIILRWTCRS